MPKKKSAVNRISELLVWVALFAAPAFLHAGKSAYVLAEYTPGGYKILRQSNSEMLAPVGSLLKPFAAWYLLDHGVDENSSVFCPPERKRTDGLRCWDPAGHGAMSVRTALVHSCNYFFLSQFRGKNLAAYEAWLRQRFDWPQNLPITRPPHVYGFDLDNGIDPEKLLGMYTRLIDAASTNLRAPLAVIRGLRDVCGGTLAGACKALAASKRFRFLWGKTGTVLEGRRNFGVALLFIEDLTQNKKILLLCYTKNKTGSQAALAAPVILHGYAKKNPH
jgi:hypothetical protein